MSQKNLPKSDLDANQAIENSYVEAADALRVISLGQALPFTWDYMSLDSSDPEVEVYTFRQGGSGGEIVGTVTITYTDSSKETLSSVEIDVA